VTKTLPNEQIWVINKFLFVFFKARPKMKADIHPKIILPPDKIAIPPLLNMLLNMIETQAPKARNVPLTSIIAATMSLKFGS
jgi:hypothetical protein